MVAARFQPSVQQLPTKAVPTSKRTKLERTASNSAERVQSLMTEFLDRSDKFLPKSRLVFLAPDFHIIPLLLEVPRHLDPNDTGILALRYNDPANKSFIEHEHWLASSIGELNRLTLEVSASSDILATKVAAVNSMEEVFGALQSWKVEEWKRQQEQFQLQLKMTSKIHNLKKQEGCSTFDNCKFMYKCFSARCLPFFQLDK